MRDQRGVELAVVQSTSSVQRRVARWTPALKRKFCEALAEGASPTRAAKALELTRQSAYYQRNINHEFAQAWQDALEEQADLYEDALRRAAIDQRNIGGIIFGLKNLRPNKWRDRHEIDRTVTPVVTPSESLHPAAQLAILEHMAQVARQKLEQGGVGAG